MTIKFSDLKADDYVLATKFSVAIGTKRALNRFHLDLGDGGMLDDLGYSIDEDDIDAYPCPIENDFYGEAYDLGWVIVQIKTYKQKNIASIKKFFTKDFTKDNENLLDKHSSQTSEAYILFDDDVDEIVNAFIIDKKYVDDLVYFLTNFPKDSSVNFLGIPVPTTTPFFEKFYDYIEDGDFITVNNIVYAYKQYKEQAASIQKEFLTKIKMLT